MIQQRIVSLVPSLSELVCSLGLRESLVGCTSFCIEPKSLTKSAAVVGGTKDPKLDLIAELKPSHILVNEEENRLEDALKLQKIAKVINTFPQSAFDVPEMIIHISKELEIPEQGQVLANKINAALGTLSQMKKEKRRFAYFIWNRPWMLASQDTYISRVLELAGFENVFAGKDRYPQVELQDLAKMQIDMILFSSEPWPFRKRDGLQLRQEWPSHPPIYLIDGKLISWYGSTTLKAIEKIVSYLNGCQTDLLKPLGI